MSDLLDEAKHALTLGDSRAEGKPVDVAAQYARAQALCMLDMAWAIREASEAIVQMAKEVKKIRKNDQSD